MWNTLSRMLRTGLLTEPIPAPSTAIPKVETLQHDLLGIVGRALCIRHVDAGSCNGCELEIQALSNPYTGVAAIFISRLLNDQPPLVFEDGEQRRDFVHVKDVSAAFVTALESDAKLWEIYNVGSGRSITVREMAALLARLLKKNIAPEILNKYRVGDIRHCFGDIGKIRDGLGFSPSRELESGMEELIAWVAKVKPPVDRSEKSLTELESSKLVV